MDMLATGSAFAIDEDVSLETLVEIAGETRDWLERGEQRYTPDNDLIDEGHGLFKEPSGNRTVAYLQFESRLAVLRFQGLSRMLNVMFDKGIFPDLSEEVFGELLSVAMKEQATPLMRAVQKHHYEDEAEPLSAGRLAKVIYANGGSSSRKRLKKQYLVTLGPLGLLNYTEQGTGQCAIGIGVVLEVFTDEVYETLQTKLFERMCKTHR